MKTAIAWVKDALATKGLATPLLYYMFKEGMVHATDGRMTVGHPFPCADYFCASGPEFQKLIERLPDPIDIDVQANFVKLRSGRLHGSVKTINPDHWPYPELSDDILPVPSRLIPALRQLRPFVSDNASRPFAMCVRIHNDTLYATNNIVVIAAPEIDLDNVDALIPYWAVDFILARTDPPPSGWSHGFNYLAFHWPNGAWMKTKLVDDKFPEQIEDIINKSGFATYEITDEWRSAYRDIADLLDETIALYPDRMAGTNNHMEVVSEVGTIAPPDLNYSGWSTKFLSPVIECATHWQPDTYPNPSPFRGDGIIGVIVGRRL